MVEQIQEGYEDHLQEEQEREAELESPASVEQREKSQHAYEGLSSSELQELIRLAFGEDLENLNGDPARFLSDATILNVAEVDAATVKSEGDSTLFEAGMPVRAEDEDGDLSKVDVSLVKSGGEWVPENPLVDLEVGSSANEGIEIGDEGIEITQVGAEDADAVRLGDKNLLFSDVSEGDHTDLLVSPTSRGVELFDVLRSIDSPETLRFKLDLPIGSELRSVVGGGAEVIDADGEASLMIPAPWAKDAQGSSVPVEMTVEGSQLVLTVDHRAGDFAYPILVDPTIYQDWGWWYEQKNMTGIKAFAPQYSAGNWWTQLGYKNGNWPTWDGLAFATVNGNLGSGVGQYYYSAPNVNSYLANATINPFYRNNANCPKGQYPHPYDYVGMAYGSGYNRMLYDNANDQGWSTIDSWGSSLVIGMGSGGINIPCWRHVMVGGVGIWLDDWQSPVLDWVGATPEGWVKRDATPRSFSVTASDTGLGVRTVRMYGVGTPEWFWNKSWCAGTYEQRCPNAESGQITYTTSGFPYEGRYNGEGIERQFSVQVIDPTDKRWKIERPIWLDGTAPTVSLSGQLPSITKQIGGAEKPQNEVGDDDELSLPTYKLQITTDDGADRSGVKEIKVYLDKDPSKEPGAVPTATKQAESCPVAGCARTLTMDYTLRLPGLAAGKHSLFIVAVDKVGNASPLDRNIEFEYIPATGMKDEYVLQHFRLPDGNDYSGEAEYPGPEIAVNVINGNVVYHQRDVEVDTDRAGLELERVYNSQQPVGKDTQWGRGWEMGQAPSFEPEQAQVPAATATMQRRGAMTSGVPVPQITGQEQFSSRLRATVKKTVSGYEVDPVESDEVAAFAQSGRIEEVMLGGDTPVYLEPRTEEELELMAPGAPTFGSSFGAAGAGNGQFGHPAGIAVDSKGTIWVVDQNNDRVQKFNAAGVFQSAFGSSGTGNGQFGRPTDIAVDAAGNLWVTDAGNHRVQKFNEKGEFLAKFGSSGTGNGQFNAAESIAIDRQGNIWIGDTYNGRLQKFNSAFEFIKVAGSKGSGQGQMLEPTGIDVGLNGDVWVADWGNNRVAVFNSNGEFVRQFGSSGTGDGQFARPDVIEVDSRGNVWVGDQINGRIQQFDQTGKYIHQFGTKGSGQGQFSFSWPMGIASDAKGNLWISDTANNRVQRWQIPAYVPTYASAFGSSGTGNGQFNHPADVAIDSEGNLWVPDKLNHRIQKFNSQGEFLAKYGSSGSGPGQLSGPSSIAFDGAGNFWVAERNNNRIQKFNSSGESLNIVGSTGSGNGQFSGPEGITVAPNGHIFVSDTYNHRVQEFNASGEFIQVVNPAGLGSIEPTGIAADTAGNIWVTDWMNGRVVEFSEAGSLVRSFGTPGSGDGQFAQPDAVEVDAKGNVWVGDQNNGRIQIFNQNGEYVTQFGAKGTGKGQFSFSYPFGLAVTANGGAWIADASNNRVQRWKTLSAVPGNEEKVLAPTFDPAVIDYQYENGKLEAMQLEDEATEGSDPALDLKLTGNQVTEVESEEGGDTSYEYESTKLKTADGPEGETKFGYDASNRLTSVTLPNGTTATITYDETSRATSVKVDPAGPEVAKTTNFFYSADPRRTKVWGGGNPEITYDIGDDGSVLKWAWAETPPTIASIAGSLWSKKGQEIENKDHTLFVTGSSPHQVASVKVIVNGTSVMEEKTCEDPAVPPSHICDQPAPMEWITHASEHAAGRMDIEVVVTDFLGRQTAERFFVTVPQQPPADPSVAQRPTFKAIKAFRQHYGLDRNNPRTEPEMNELILELLYEWEGHNPTVMAAMESWGVPMRSAELAEMEWRKQYTTQAAEAIPQWAEEHAPSTFGGHYVDDPAGGKVYVGFTGSSESQAALVEALKQSGVLINPSQVFPFPTPPANSLASLEGSRVAVSAAIMSNPTVRDATVSISVPEEGSQVRVGATNVPLVDAFLNQQFGPGAPIVVTARQPLRPFGYSRFSIQGPAYGGQALVGGNGEGCTAGFSSRAPSGSNAGQQTYKYFLLSAGHCYGLGVGVGRLPSRQSPTAYEIGKVRRTAWAPEYVGDSVGVDVSAILIDESLRSHSVLNGSPLRPEPVQGVQRPRKWACWSGRNGGPQCGRIVGPEEFLYGGRLSVAFEVKGVSAEGDSGAPVWDPISHKAIGSLVGGVSDCWTGGGGREWCSRSAFTPLLGSATNTYPESAIGKLGVEVLKQG